MKVSALVPTYNGKHLLQKHLESIAAALRSGDELLVLDDASTDATESWVTAQANRYQQKYGIDVRCLVNSVNIRFARSVNHGAQKATGSLLFVCNNDVSVEPDCIDILRAHFSDPALFAVGCLEYEGKSTQVASGKNKLWFTRGLFQHARDESMTTGSTAWASGGSALFSKEKWDILGGFDPAFSPAYWEDIDISYRAHQRGWKVLFDRSAIVYHQHESTHSKVFGTAKMQEMSWKNALYFTRKHTRGWQKVAYLFWYVYWWYQRKKHA